MQTMLVFRVSGSVWVFLPAFRATQVKLEFDISRLTFVMISTTAISLINRSVVQKVLLTAIYV